MALLQVPLLHSSPITSPRLQAFNQQGGLSIRERDGVIASRRPSRLHVVCSVRENVAPPQEAQSVPAVSTFGKSNFNRLVPDFHFGSASASYQVEGAWNIDGRKPSIWDDFCHNFPDKITDKSTGDIATDTYHRYEEDIKLMKDLGLDSYRFSLSWSRILPDGTLAGGKNQKGIDYYNKLINKILEYGLTPFVTIFHWDVPSALEKGYGGFRNRKIVQDFKDYAKVCFDEFGDRVNNWITVNEAWTLSSMGYGLGWHAPGRCSAFLGCAVPEGDSLVEPYIVSHHLILAHAEAVKLYREKYNVGQKGQIGISLTAKWFKPYSNQRKDVQAAERGVDFMIGWYLDPIVYGDYPFTMRVMLRDRLPTFTEEERKLITGSYDFIGMNYYTSAFAEGLRFEDDNNKPLFNIKDNYVEDHYKRDGKYIGEPTESWIYIAPDGLKDILLYVKKIYNDPKIYITENGMCEINNPDQPLAQAIDDKQRETYLKLHLAQILQAIQDGVNVKGYFHWSFTDNFEWQEGYTQRFGMYYIDYADKLKRVPKTNSIPWFKKFLVS